MDVFDKPELAAVKPMSPYQLRIVAALSAKRTGEVYQGTVPGKVKLRRRAASKAARKARRANR